MDKQPDSAGAIFDDDSSQSEMLSLKTYIRSISASLLQLEADALDKFDSLLAKDSINDIFAKFISEHDAET